MDVNKKCIKCLNEKPISFFSLFKRKEKVYRRSYCKSCCIAIQRKSTQKEIKCFRCGKFELKYSNNKYCSLKCRYDAQKDRIEFKHELGLLKGRMTAYSIIE